MENKPTLNEALCEGPTLTETPEDEPISETPYEELVRRTERGDREAATKLLRPAAQRRDIGPLQKAVELLSDGAPPDVVLRGKLILAAASTLFRGSASDEVDLALDTMHVLKSL